MVTNLLNSRSLILKVTDRGPVAPGRMLDVSMAAAKRLGFLGQGLTPVRIQVLSYPQDYLVSQISSSVPAPTAN
jgi:rare lipoprotein A